MKSGLFEQSKGKEMEYFYSLHEGEIVFSSHLLLVQSQQNYYTFRVMKHLIFLAIVDQKAFFKTKR